MADDILAAQNLSVAYRGRTSDHQVLLEVTLAFEPGRIVGLAGESGSGKSTLALCLMGYRQAGQRVLAGHVELDGGTITGAPTSTLRRVWGSRLAYLPQDTSTSLNPALTIGRHFQESLHKHAGLSRTDALKRAADWLARVGIPEPQHALGRYPHQFSGGQQQRIAVALALSLDPAMLILDEPTTGLDVVTQARVNELVVALAREANVALLYVSHNLAMLATVCDDLAIMYAGQLVEYGPVREVYAAPRHPYTRALIAAVPSIDSDEPPQGIPGVPRPAVAVDECCFVDRCPIRIPQCHTQVPMVEVGVSHQVRCIRTQDASGNRVAAPRVRLGKLERRSADPEAAPVLAARAVSCSFARSLSGGPLLAVDDVSVEVSAGRTLGIAGESGSGKSTLLKAIAGLVRPDAGEISFGGTALAPTSGRRTVEQRRAVQIVFQNPDSTLNPRHTIAQSLMRPLRLFGVGADRADRRARLVAAMKQVRISPDLLDRYPRNLSGGQRQRIAIARALLADPVVLLCDEITSALDVSVQASILELLLELRESRQLAMVFVTHDLGVLRAIADEVVVMQNGQVRERGEVIDVLRTPRDDYTKRLLDAIPTPHLEPTAPTGVRAGRT